MPKKFIVIHTEIYTRSFVVEAETPLEAIGRSILLQWDGEDKGEVEYQKTWKIAARESN